MLDIRLIRENPKEIEEKLRRKDPEISVEKLLTLDEELRAAKTEVERLKAERNQLSKEIGEIKRQASDATPLLEEAAQMADQIHALDHKMQELEAAFNDALARLPNLPMDEIKISQDPKDNVILKTWGNRPTFSFAQKNHVELNELLHLFDFKRGASLTGTGWPVYRNLGARLEWALINYMIATNLKNGFEQWMLPACVRPEILFDSGQLPKFENQQFKIHDPDYHLYLIPTAEVPLNGLHAGEIFAEEELPRNYMAYTPCFRREAGAAGSNERGLIRTHQFNKVELFSFTLPEKSGEAFDKMVASAEEILQGLELHYRLALLVTGDMSYGSARTVDVEVWLPGQERYYEVSSISNCTDYQARRSQTRFRRKGEKPEFVHTLNGSGLATSRLMVGLLENNQQPDGSVVIPKVLRPYLGGLERLEPVL